MHFPSMECAQIRLLVKTHSQLNLTHVTGTVCKAMFTLPLLQSNNIENDEIDKFELTLTERRMLVQSFPLPHQFQTCLTAFQFSAGSPVSQKESNPAFNPRRGPEMRQQQSRSFVDEFALCVCTHVCIGVSDQPGRCTSSLKVFMFPLLLRDLTMRRRGWGGIGRWGRESDLTVSQSCRIGLPHRQEKQSPTSCQKK